MLGMGAAEIRPKSQYKNEKKDQGIDGLTNDNV